MNDFEIIDIQKSICKKYKATYFESPDSLKVGISKNIKTGILPINGLRHPPQGDTTGWYIWAGEEWSNEPNFFVPLHVKHLNEWCPEIIKFLGLPPGWRFLVAGEYEDVWKDLSLLNI
jgi:hypothetical protein